MRQCIVQVVSNSNRTKRSSRTVSTAKEFKVVKLPRNGPKEGQSYSSWAAGKKRSDIDWAKRKFDAISKGKL
mgnify:CR=1 FL=1